MIPFVDRTDAGQQLAKELQQYSDADAAVVIALPRGGIPVAYRVAQALNLPLDVVYPRKIGAPQNPEYAIGAVTESGEGMLNRWAVEATGATEEYIEAVMAEEQAVAQKRLARYRQWLPKQNLAGKVAIIIDDGIATGATMEAAIASVRAEGAAQIVVAVPVAPSDTVERLRNTVDGLFVLSVPEPFGAVGQFYQIFGQTSDEEIEHIFQSIGERRQ